MSNHPSPLTLEVPDSTLADLAQRLARTRWPDEPPLAPWTSGTSLAYMNLFSAVDRRQLLANVDSTLG